jgi:predicted nucleic acid-binding protein
MIHLDTNILIEIVTLGSPMAHRLAEWLKTGEQLATSAMDSFIAASAILAGAPLLTKNLADFRIFEPFGLHLQR